MVNPKLYVNKAFIQQVNFFHSSTMSGIIVIEEVEYVCYLTSNVL